VFSAADKGPGDIRLGRVLVQLKRTYPDRVFLIIGNRDLNKIKLTAEIDPYAQPAARRSSHNDLPDQGGDCALSAGGCPMCGLRAPLAALTDPAFAADCRTDPFWTEGGARVTAKEYIDGLIAADKGLVRPPFACHLPCPSGLCDADRWWLCCAELCGRPGEIQYSWYLPLQFTDTLL
jgi:hypothetical protein